MAIEVTLQKSAHDDRQYQVLADGVWIGNARREPFVNRYAAHIRGVGGISGKSQRDLIERIAKRLESRPESGK